MILKKGDNGPEVAELQHLLIKNGYSGVSADGDFGPATDTSVRNFQAKHGLKPDGIVGNMTITALKGEKIVTYPDIKHDESLQIADHLLSDDEYYKEIFKKDIIVIHHTAGSSNPINSIDGWESDKSSDGGILKVGTAYVMGRSSSSSADTQFDGKIYRAFDPKYWCHHLGTKLANNKNLNQRSIGIEICNYGPLKRTKDGRYLNYVNREVRADQVVALPTLWKGYTYFEKYTAGQIAALKTLLVELGNTFNIDIKTQVTADWFQLNSIAMNGTSGLWTHVHYREDKTDCFPQAELIDMINSL